VTAEENKAVVLRYFEEFHNRRVGEILEQIMAPELLEPTRHATDRLRTAFPDYQLTVDDQVAAGDRVASVWTGQGTHRGEWASPIGPIAPTGTAVTWTGTTTLRLVGGKIAEVVGTNWDHLGILQQVGALPAAAPRSGA
jgi:predicted ester cyclase